MTLVVDTSALVAILRAEPAADRLLEALSRFQDRRISAATWVEFSLVVAGRRVEAATALERLDGLLQALGLVVVSVDLQQARLAREGFLRYGKGRHPAGLNYGDCFGYALAKALQARLLFVGDDFTLTDVSAANVD